MYIVDRLRRVLARRLNQRCTDPLEQYLYIIQIINRMVWIIGGDIFTPNFSPTNWRFCLVMFDMFVFFWINVYNLYITYGNLVDFMYCLQTIFFVGSCGIKFYVFLRHKPLIFKLHDFIVNFNETFCGNREQDELLSSTAHNNYALAVLFGVCSSTAAGLILIYALTWSLTVEYVLPFGFLIPAVSIDNIKGFALNYVFQFFECFLAICGIVASEIAFFMFLLNAGLQVDMMRLELGRLGTLAASNTHGQHAAEIQRRIHTIIGNHIAHLDFTKTVGDLFRVHFFIVFGCIFFQLVSIVVVAVAVPDWYPGYFLFSMLTFQLFFSSALGQVFHIKCDQLTIAIYDVPWYNMDVQDQKAMKLLLMASHKPILISYGFGDVNMRAFFEIYRKTYSIGMMMVSVNEDN